MYFLSYVVVAVSSYLVKSNFTSLFINSDVCLPNYCMRLLADPTFQNGFPKKGTNGSPQP